MASKQQPITENSFRTFGPEFRFRLVTVSFFCLFYLTWIRCSLLLFFTTSSIKNWFVLATGPAEYLIQVSFRQSFSMLEHDHWTVKIETYDVFIFSSTWNQFVIFDVIAFPLAAFVLFRDLCHKNAWINHIISGLTSRKLRNTRIFFTVLFSAEVKTETCFKLRNQVS